MEIFKTKSNQILIITERSKRNAIGALQKNGRTEIFSIQFFFAMHRPFGYCMTLKAIRERF